MVSGTIVLGSGKLVQILSELSINIVILISLIGFFLHIKSLFSECPEMLVRTKIN